MLKTESGPSSHDPRNGTNPTALYWTAKSLKKRFARSKGAYQVQHFYSPFTLENLQVADDEITVISMTAGPSSGHALVLVHVDVQKQLAWILDPNDAVNVYEVPVRSDGKESYLWLRPYEVGADPSDLKNWSRIFDQIVFKQPLHWWTSVVR